MFFLKKKHNKKVNYVSIIFMKLGTYIHSILVHPRLDLVNKVVRPLLFTKLSLFIKSNLDKE